MALKHSVYDSDTHFSINPITRAIKNESTTKTGLIQYDHNSERFTFEMPRVIEGHDMSLCDIVEVHYVNIDGETKVESRGVFPVTDMQVDNTDENIVIFSWLISQAATQYVGNLNFLVRFACVDERNNLIYIWNTGVHVGIAVSDGIFNHDFVLEKYADVLAQWKASITAITFLDIRQTKSSTESGGENVWTAFFEGLEDKELKVYNGKSAYQIAVEKRTFSGTEEEFAQRVLCPEFYNGDQPLKKVKFVLNGTTLKITTET